MPVEAVGTADQLRALADALDAGTPEPLADLTAEHEARVQAVRARYPGVPLASLNRRIFCHTHQPVGSARSWHTVTALDSGILADLYIYGEIGEWGITAADVVAQLASITATQLTVHLNSGGGEVFEGQAIRNRLRDYPAAVEVRVDAFAASIASIIAMAGDRIVMNRQARMMIHDASGLVVGNPTDMRMMADVLDAVSDDMAATYAARAGGTPKAWRAAMRAETWYSAEQAVAAGLADEAIIDVRPDVEAYASAGQPYGGDDKRAPDGARDAPRPPDPGPAPPAPDYERMAAFVATHHTRPKEAAL